MLTKICPNCGAENEPDAQRCVACETRLVGYMENDRTDSELPSEDAFTLQPSEEQDLPDLLNALKQDGEITPDGPGFDDHEVSGMDESDLVQSDLSQEDDVPDWLRRIRERAQKEEDSAGEITQKITAAQENLARSESENEHENFASWIQSLRGDSEEEPSELLPDTQESTQATKESPEESPDWLSKIRKVKGKSPGEDTDQVSDPAEKSGDSLLQWLVALEEGKETLQPVNPEETEVPESTLAQDDLGETQEEVEETQKIQVEIPRGKIVPALDATRDEQLQANLFSSMVVDEQAQRPLRELDRKGSSWVVRLIATLVLVGVLSAGLFGGWPGGGMNNGLSPEQEAMWSSIRDLPERASMLVVADYQAGFSEEVHLIARSVFLETLKPDMEISLLATQPSGLLLSRRLLADLSNELDLQINDLGFIPTPAIGAYSVAGTRYVGQPLDLSGPELPDAPDGVFILADSYESARFWVEQLSARTPNANIFLLVTAQAGPMLAPYLEAGQVAGLASGTGEIQARDGYGIPGEPELHLKAAYQIGTLLMAVVIASAAIMTGRPKSKMKERGDRELE